MSRDASGLKHLGVGLGWVWLRDGSEPEADRVMTISLGMVLSECTFRSHGGAMAIHLQGCKSTGWDSPLIGVAVGPWPCKILCAAWHKIHSCGQLKFFFCQQQRFRHVTHDMSWLT